MSKKQFEVRREVRAESNRGGTFLEIDQVDDERVRIRVGHNCVIVADATVPAFILGELFSRHWDAEAIKSGLWIDEGYREEFRKALLAMIEVRA